MSAGCGVRQAYTPPVPAAPATWSRGIAEDATRTDAERLGRWWEGFADSKLTELVRRAIEGNRDVRVSLSRLREARATVRSTRAALFPTADASGSARVNRTGSAAIIGGTPVGAGSSLGGLLADSYSVGLDASWEIDVFGGIRSSIDAAAATAEARAADLQDVLVSLCAEVALNYVDVRSLQRRLEIAQSNVDLQQETLELTQFRAQAGLATDLDVQQALSNVDNTRAQVASLQAQAGQSLHALAVLLGQPPTELDAELNTAGPIPEAPVEDVADVPAEALRRRPDVRSAERQLAAQFAQVNAARADLYPTFRLAGSIGLDALSIARLFVPGALAWSASPSVNTRVFNRQQLRENVVVQDERQRQAARTYETRVLTALQEVEDSLVAVALERVRRDRLMSAANAAQSAADLSLQLYTQGLRDFRDVLDSQRSLLTLQDSLAGSTAQVSTNMIRLYKALGGGWSAAEVLDDSLTDDGS